MYIYNMRLKGNVWDQERRYQHVPENEETEKCMVDVLRKYKKDNGNIKIQKLRTYTDRAHGHVISQYAANSDSGKTYLLEFLSGE